MKIKRFLAANMREAMRMVREEQGADAVILSNRRVEGGIEVVAATDYDAALVQSAAIRAEAVAPAPLPQAPPPPAAAEPVRQSLPSAQPRAYFGQAQGLAPAPSADIDGLKSEMQGLRRLMEQQIASQAWGDLKANSPIRADVVRTLINLGIELKLARSVAADVPEGTTSDRARFLPMALLSRRIPTCKHEWLEGAGDTPSGRQDVVALVGATGVGKTTTIAKLAARYVQNFGLRDVALVTTDHFRIGAQEQLFTYGRLLGVPVLTADNHHELCLALQKLRDRKLVLIDTAGMSPRDENLHKQFAMLSGLPVPNRTALVLSASSQLADLDDQYQRFAPAAPSAVILTKLDEAAKVGSAISAIVRHGLPLAYLADGQRVPEDLAAARPDSLVLRAMQSNRKSAALPDDDEISLQFAGAAHA